SLANPRDLDAAGAIARESSRYQGGFLSGKTKLSRRPRRRRRYAAPGDMGQPPAGSSTQQAGSPSAMVASTDETDPGLSFADAYNRAMSTEGAGWKKATEGVLDQLGLRPHQSHIAVGDWEGS